MNKTTKIIEHSKNKTILTQEKAINAINEMIAAGEDVTYYSVRQKTGISKSFLYKNEEVNALIKANLSENKKRIDSPEHKDLLKARKEIKKLKARIVELEKELEKYRSEE